MPSEKEPIYSKDPLSGHFGDASDYFPLEKLGRDALMDELPQSPQLISEALDPEQILILHEALNDVTLSVSDREKIMHTLSLNGVECIELKSCEQIVDGGIKAEEDGERLSGPEIIQEEFDQMPLRTDTGKHHSKF